MIIWNLLVGKCFLYVNEPTIKVGKKAVVMAAMIVLYRALLDESIIRMPLAGDNLNRDLK